MTWAFENAHLQGHTLSNKATPNSSQTAPLTGDQTFKAQTQRHIFPACVRISHFDVHHSNKQRLFPFIGLYQLMVRLGIDSMVV